MKKIVAMLTLTLLIACMTASALAAYGVAGSCRGTTKFDVTTGLLPGSITLKPTQYGTYSSSFITFRNYGDYTITVKQIKGGSQSKTCETYWNLFGNASCGTKISLKANSTYRITVTPKGLPGGAKWSTTAFWNLSSASCVTKVTMR